MQWTLTNYSTGISKQGYGYNNVNRSVQAHPQARRSHRDTYLRYIFIFFFISSKMPILSELLHHLSAGSDGAGHYDAAAAAHQLQPSLLSTAHDDHSSFGATSATLLTSKNPTRNVSLRSNFLDGATSRPLQEPPVINSGAAITGPARGASSSSSSFLSIEKAPYFQEQVRAHNTTLQKCEKLELQDSVEGAREYTSSGAADDERAEDHETPPATGSGASTSSSSSTSAVASPDDEHQLQLSTPIRKIDCNAVTRTSGGDVSRHLLDPTRPLIFQDVDGVLNNETEDAMLNDKLISRLDQVVGDSDAQIVLSSHWRKSPQLVDMLFTRLSMTKNHLADRIVGATPSLCRGVECRATEIYNWVKEHPGFKGNWIALDDWDLFKQTDGSHMVDHFVKTDPMTGISEDDAEEAVRLLDRPVMTEDDHPPFPLGLGDSIGLSDVAGSSAIPGVVAGAAADFVSGAGADAEVVSPVLAGASAATDSAGAVVVENPDPIIFTTTTVANSADAIAGGTTEALDADTAAPVTVDDSFLQTEMDKHDLAVDNSTSAAVQEMDATPTASANDQSLADFFGSVADQDTGPSAAGEDASSASAAQQGANAMQNLLTQQEEAEAEAEAVVSAEATLL
ncbi:unnamed protein product [Amoebophrya sp. A120]|nr:unnamed protein product [Amoebophrya sp. A120]|eukprot:GSA120T00016693001.1